MPAEKCDHLWRTFYVSRAQFNEPDIFDFKDILIGASLPL
jgi:hypothetical protein